MTEVNTEAKWSGAGPVPQNRTRVRINFNDLGTGIVRGQFVSHGYLGVLVELDNPPAWWRKQNGPGRLAHVFGAELDYDAPEYLGSLVDLDKAPASRLKQYRTIPTGAPMTCQHCGATFATDGNPWEAGNLCEACWRALRASWGR